ncbi:MAG: methyltransferase [Bacteroidota bacterium]
MAFHFRQFSVEDEQSTLRVGTDVMLLGSWATPQKALRILDIGTGCGVLALMMAQKSNGLIDAIDIDLPSVTEARGNFTRSPWGDRLSAIHESLYGFTGRVVPGYDFIITNPPYFADSLKSPSDRKNIARHDHSLTHEELVRCVRQLLSPGGLFALILPAGAADAFIELCDTGGLILQRRMKVSQKPGSPPLRILMEFSNHGCNCTCEDSMTVRTMPGGFSDAYLALTAPFHQFFSHR